MELLTNKINATTIAFSRTVFSLLQLSGVFRWS